MPSSRVHCALAFLVAVSLTSCGTEARPNEPIKEQDHALKIYYLWTTEGDPHQHSALKAGVEKAKQDAYIQRLLGKVELHSLIDPVTREEAIALARKLRSSPDTLAVIGHQFSGTTWATLPIFADAGIPVMVPSATSPYLFFEHRERDEPNLELARNGEHDEQRCEEPDCYFVRPGTNQAVGRFHNAFRLVPADVPDQVSAIQLTIRKLRKQGKIGSDNQNKPPEVMLICDQTTHNNATVYSRPMCDYLERFTSHRDLISGGETKADYRIVSSRNIDLDHGDLWGLITAIRAADPDCVVLVGYPDLARAVLLGLKERDDADAKAQRRKRTFVISDGAFSNDTPEKLRRFADIYFTYFAHPHDQGDTCNFSEGSKNGPGKANNSTKAEAKRTGGKGKDAKDPIEEPVAETAEAFAYDAVLILARGVEKCGDHLDRACLLDFLTQQQDLTGHCEHYDFHLGERQHAAYYVYYEGSRQPGVTLQPEWCATSEDDGLRPYFDGCTSLTRPGK